MKHLIGAILLTLLSTTAFAADLTFFWAPNTTDLDIVGYTLYKRTSPGAPRVLVKEIPGDGAVVSSGPIGLTTLQVDPIIGATLHFTLTARDGLYESGESNVVVAFIPGERTDSDGDGVRDLVEMARGTDPRDAASFPADGGLTPPTLQKYEIKNASGTVVIQFSVTVN